MFGRRIDHYMLSDAAKARVEAVIASAGLNKNAVRPIFAVVDTDDGHALHVTENLLNDRGNPYIADFASYELASKPHVIALSPEDALILMRDSDTARV